MSIVVNITAQHGVECTDCIPPGPPHCTANGILTDNGCGTPAVYTWSLSAECETTDPDNPICCCTGGTATVSLLRSDCDGVFP